MRGFFKEFKKFIARGNVIDLAVGVIIGSAFTAIVNAVTKNVLTPIVNYVLALILGEDSLSNVFTYLKRVEVDGVVDLTQSIYIDWGLLINAFINFILIALVLFLIVRTINKIQEGNKRIKNKIKDGKPTKEDRKEMRKLGINLFDNDAVKAYMDKKEADKKAQEIEEAAKKAIEEAEARKHSTEGLLEQIKELLEKQVK